MTRTLFSVFFSNFVVYLYLKQIDRRTDWSQTNFNVEQAVQTSSFSVHTRCNNLSKTHVRFPPTPEKSFFVFLLMKTVRFLFSL